jgi:hypothetical protein
VKTTPDVGPSKSALIVKSFNTTEQDFVNLST